MACDLTCKVKTGKELTVLVLLFVMAKLLGETYFSLSSWHKENVIVQTLCWWAIHTVDPS